MHDGEKPFPKQLDPAGTFGEPPLTVYNNRSVAIDVYFWVDQTTSIHEHSFIGAFAVLRGTSLNATYQFTEHVKFDERLRGGLLSPVAAHILQPDECMEVLPGSQFIHNVVHLDIPSVTILIRADISCEMQLIYLPPSLALTPLSNCSVQLRRRIQFYKLVARLNPEEFCRQLELCLHKASSVEIAHILLSTHSLFQGKRPELARILNGLPSQHDNLLSYLLPALHNESRLTLLVDLRRHVATIEGRYLLASLLVSHSRTGFINLMKYRFRERWNVMTIGLLKEIINSNPSKFGFTWDSSADEVVLAYLSRSHLSARGMSQVESHPVIRTLFFIPLACSGQV